ncbi:MULTISPECIES: NAD-dependent epimerase/dehydratase family protein [unclassified Streptomyces]|uniref:NAD-dependent epimerase/dehydratase family protein n=1 Tax=unclassified Streptomyces TaxID=2593676 RepID=UPI00343A12FF
MHMLVTGAAGFVGSHAVRHLLETGHRVVATDSMPAHRARRLNDLGGPAFRYVAGDLHELLPGVLEGVDEVWHFAANTDIPLGATDTGVDLREGIVLTQSVLEGMRRRGVRSLVFPSSSAVYGDTPTGAVAETAGPLLPNSLYGAGKVACEALVSAYCDSFGLRARIYRLGNVLGGGMARGIVRDFVRKLEAEPDRLTVLGDGQQRKSYVLVDDVVAAMGHLTRAADGGGRPACDVYNVAAGGSVPVREVARLTAEAMGLPEPEIVPSGDRLSWTGDQPVIELNIDKARAAGWQPRYDARAAVSRCAERIVREAAAPYGVSA